MEKLEHGKFYHIYNRGTNGQDIFIHSRDYEHFLELYTLFTRPVSESFAWCLMKNHFHFLIWIKPGGKISYLNSKYSHSKDLYKKWKVTLPGDKDKANDIHLTQKPTPERMYQHLFSAYAKWFNAKHKRTGSLLEHTFRRKWIDNAGYLKRVLLYIHMNPVKHGFCDHPVEYPWTSYRPMVSNGKSWFKKQEALTWFANMNDFKMEHQKKQNFEDIQDCLIEYDW